MVRAFKYHEKKLLKKVDFLQWSSDQTLQEIQVMRRYHLQKRHDYIHYNKLCGQIKKLANQIALLDPKDEFRNQSGDRLVEKLYQMGILSQKHSLSLCDKVTVSAFCRRRITVILVRLKMAESISQAVKMVEQGHIRVGPEIIKDPAYLVTRDMEDFVTWAENSSYKTKIMRYHDQLDDFDLLQL